MKRTFWLTVWPVLTVALSISLFPSPALAQSSSPPTLQIEAGLDGYCSVYYLWCPLYVTLSNEGEDVEGRLIISGEQAETPPYSLPVVLPTHSRKGYFLYLPPIAVSGELKVELVTVDGLALAQTVISLNLLDEHDVLLGVTGERSSTFNFLSGVPLTSGDTAVAHLDFDIFPPDPLGWELLDTLILNDGDTTRLDGERRVALETWIEHGGHLIVGGGAGALRTVGGIGDLLPVSVTEVQEVEDLHGLLETGVRAVAVGPYPVAVSELRAEGETLVEQDGLVLVARRPYGDGYVDFLAFDAGLNLFTRWDDTEMFWTWLLRKDYRGERFAVHSSYNAAEAVNIIPGVRPPSILQILAFTVIYIVVIGPVNYFVLRRLGRLELAWLSIPALIFIFSSCAYLTGFQIRGTRPVLNQIAVAYLPTGGKTARVSAVSGLFSPWRTSYDVQVEGNGVYPLDNVLSGRERSAVGEVSRSGDGMVLKDARLNVGEVAAFVGEKYVPMTSSAAVDLHLTTSVTGMLTLQGTVRNGDVPLQDAALLVGGYVQRLGDLEAGAEAVASLEYHPLSEWDDDLADRVVGKWWEIRKDRELYRRHSFVQAMFYGGPPYWSPLTDSFMRPDRAYLLGWGSEEKPVLPFSIVGRQSVYHALTLYVLELPLPVLTFGGEGNLIIPPVLIKCKPLFMSEGAAGENGEYSLEPGAEVRLECTLPFDLALREVDRLALSLSSRSYLSPPRVLLWDVQAGEWRDVGADWGEIEIPDGGRYLEDGYRIGVELKGGEEGGGVGKLRFTVEGRR